MTSPVPSLPARKAVGAVVGAGGYRALPPIVTSAHGGTGEAVRPSLGNNLRNLFHRGARYRRPTSRGEWS
jgi:hypothetical protein